MALSTGEREEMPRIRDIGRRAGLSLLHGTGTLSGLPKNHTEDTQQFFSGFPSVTFPISLASVSNQELTSYAWTFPNVVTNGHCWYLNTSTFIEHNGGCLSIGGGVMTVLIGVKETIETNLSPGYVIGNLESSQRWS